MSKESYAAPANGISQTELASAQARLAALEAPQRAAMGPSVLIAGKHQVNIQGGVVTGVSSSRKDGSNTAYVNQATPGFIEVPGMGKTSITAAKAGGLIPHNWVEGQPLPFEQPAEARKGAEAGADKATSTDAPEESHSAHIAKLAGEVLDRVDASHGSEITDALLDQVTDSGDPESILDQLPEGFKPAQVQQVMAGFIAQANSTLASVGASVPMLQELLTDDELRTARRATLAKSDDMLQDLGRMAVDRLVTLPKTDPQGFQDMVDAMDKKSREMLRYDRQRNDWILTTPNGQQMSYGSAVRSGLIRV